MARVWDVTLEDTCRFFKGLPPKNIDPFATSYTDKFNKVVPTSLQDICLATILLYDNNILQTSLALLPSRLSKQVDNLLKNVFRYYVNYSRGCWLCYGKEDKQCSVCDTCVKFRSIQIKHNSRKLSTNDIGTKTMAQRSRSTPNIEYFKLTISGLDHMVGNKLIQKLLGDLLYSQFRNVYVHYICVIVGNWERYREKTTDRAFVVLRGHDSKAAGTYVIDLFKNPILKSITIVPSRNQQLSPIERAGGFLYRCS